MLILRKIKILLIPEPPTPIYERILVQRLLADDRPIIDMAQRHVFE